MSKLEVDLLGDIIRNDPKDVSFTLRLSKEELDVFKKACDYNELGMSSVIRIFMKQYAMKPLKVFRITDIYKE